MNLELNIIQLQQGSIYEEVLLFFTKKRKFFEFQYTFKEVKTQRKFSDNPGQNIFGFFCILAQFLFTTSETS